MAAADKQEDAFRADVIGSSLLENAIAWIAANMNPEDVFSDAQLELWATEAGYEVDKEE